MNPVISAILNSKENTREYFEMTCKGRLAGGAGSIYDQFDSVEALEKALLEAEWTETTHPSVMEGCKVYVANLAGRFGLVEIDSLTEDAVLIADDRKNTGRVAMTISGIRGKEVPVTYLITGKEDGIEGDVVYTFHPGEPVRPSVVEVSTLSHGSKVSKAQAKELGFDLAKIV